LFRQRCIFILTFWPILVNDISKKQENIKDIGTGRDLSLLQNIFYFLVFLFFEKRNCGFPVGIPQ